MIKVLTRSYGRKESFLYYLSSVLSAREHIEEVIILFHYREDTFYDVPKIVKENDLPFITVLEFDNFAQILSRWIDLVFEEEYLALIDDDIIFSAKDLALGEKLIKDTDYPYVSIYPVQILSFDDKTPKLDLNIPVLFYPDNMFSFSAGKRISKFYDKEDVKPISLSLLEKRIGCLEHFLWILPSISAITTTSFHLLKQGRWNKPTEKDLFEIRNMFKKIMKVS